MARSSPRRIGYTLTPALSAHVDVENIFDEYYPASSFNENWITPGTPRTIRARLQGGRLTPR